MKFNFEEFDQIFGEANPEIEESGPTTTNPNNTNPNPSFVFRIFAADQFHLKFHVTDFLSSYWSSTLSLLQFEDLRDSIGIGGSWSDFINYVTSSFKSKHVKLALSSHSHSNGVTSAKLVARKSKGMPLVSITLSKLENPAATEAIANMSLELFKAYAIIRDSLTKEQEHGCQLTRGISAEMGNYQHIKRKLDAYTHAENQGLHRTSNPGNMNSLKSDNSSITASLYSSDKQTTNEVQSTKVARRVAPAHRRAKVRGAVLQDSEEEDRS